MKITLVGKGAETLLAEFDAASIQYERRFPKPGEIMNAGRWIEIASAVSSLGISAVIVQWLKGKESREVTITDQNNKIFHCKGFAVDDVKKLLEASKAVMAYDTKPNNDRN
jgi:hypothetical protein